MKVLAAVVAVVVAVMAGRGGGEREGPFPPHVPTPPTHDGPHIPLPLPLPHPHMLDREGADEKEDREPLVRTSKILPFFNPVNAFPQVSSPPFQDHIPHCAGPGKYCAFDRNYPMDKVNAIVDRFYNDVQILYDDLYHIPARDLLYYDNTTTPSARRGGHFVCESAVDYIRPGWAQNLRGEWVAILNTDRFPQTVKIETCRYGNKRCEYLPPCYKSRCAQRYSYTRLLSLNPHLPSLRPVIDVFQIPTACSCFVEDFTYY
ncbi:neurotrophin 1-like [Portunus trituberculatus]|uniref:neurotrophin 1-like n=1 Tax=Portunus trituberculatus TaxID=210409 RepID=UPI001E1CFE1F|nr:neurotrophin 1-like [Portunus trituberculatus]